MIHMKFYARHTKIYNGDVCQYQMADRDGIRLIEMEWVRNEKKLPCKGIRECACFIYEAKYVQFSLFVTSINLHPCVRCACDHFTSKTDSAGETRSVASHANYNTLHKPYVAHKICRSLEMNSKWREHRRRGSDEAATIHRRQRFEILN